MSDILKNKEVLILVGEIAVVAGVCFYFSRKNKQLSTQLEILAKKFEEQQQLINKHEEIIHQLIQITQEQHASQEQLSRLLPDRPSPPQHAPPKPAPGNHKKIHMGSPQAPPVHHPARPHNTPAPIPTGRPMAQPNRVSFQLPAPEEESEIEEESESELEPESDPDENLDEILKEELLELEEEIHRTVQSMALRKGQPSEGVHLKEQMKSNKKN